MRTSWHDLAGRPVVDRDGRRAGRVVDLLAADREGRLQVVALLVGRIGLLGRIGQSRWFRGSASALEVPVEQVSAIEAAVIRLSVVLADLHRVDPRTVRKGE